MAAVALLAVGNGQSGHLVLGRVSFWGVAASGRWAEPAVVCGNSEFLSGHKCGPPDTHSTEIHCGRGSISYLKVSVCPFLSCSVAFGGFPDLCVKESENLRVLEGPAKSNLAKSYNVKKGQFAKIHCISMCEPNTSGR